MCFSDLITQARPSIPQLVNWIVYIGSLNFIYVLPTTITEESPYSTPLEFVYETMGVQDIFLVIDIEILRTNGLPFSVNCEVVTVEQANWELGVTKMENNQYAEIESHRRENNIR